MVVVGQDGRQMKRMKRANDRIATDLENVDEVVAILLHQCA